MSSGDDQMSRKRSRRDLGSSSDIIDFDSSFNDEGNQSSSCSVVSVGGYGTMIKKLKCNEIDAEDATIPPKFLTTLKDVDTDVKDVAVFQVKTKGLPKPTLTWYKDNLPLEVNNTDIWHNDETGTLIIKSVSFEDVGIYKVVATNHLGTDTTQANLIVKQIPTFLSNISDMNIMIGQAFVVNANIVGCPTPKLKWLKDGKPIVSDERIGFEEGCTRNLYSMCVNKATVHDGGNCTLAASNVSGQSMQSWKISVSMKARFLEPLPANISRRKGDKRGDFILKTEGMPEPKVEVMANGKNVNVEKIQQHVYNVFLGDLNEAIEYAVVATATNKFGKDETATVITISAPPRIKNMLEPLYRFKENSSQEIKVTLMPTNPVPKVDWYHNRKKMDTEGRITITNSKTCFSLKIDRISFEDAGEWAFKGVNDFGEIWTRSILIVEGKPQFLLPLAPSMRVRGTEPYELDVQIRDFCKSDLLIKWRTDDIAYVFKPVITTERSGNDYVSRIKFTASRSQKYIKIVASNKYGESESICFMNWTECVLPKCTQIRSTENVKDFHVQPMCDSVVPIKKPKGGTSTIECVSDEMYLVEKILDKRINNGITEYLLRWKDYGSEHDDWEAETNLECPDLVKDYEFQQLQIDFKNLSQKFEHLKIEFKKMSQEHTKLLRDVHRRLVNMEEIQQQISHHSEHELFGGTEEEYEGEDEEDEYEDEEASTTPKSNASSRGSVSKTKRQGCKQCLICEKIFPSSTTLRLHLRADHPGWVYSCKVCKIEYKQKGSLTTHVKEKHDFNQIQKDAFGEGDDWFCKLVKGEPKTAQRKIRRNKRRSTRGDVTE